MAKKKGQKKDNTLTYVLLGLGVLVAGAVFLNKKEGEETTEKPKTTPDVGNDKNDTPKEDKPKVDTPSKPEIVKDDFGYDPNRIFEPSIQPPKTEELLSGREVEVQTSSNGSGKNGAYVETFDFNL